MSIHDITTIVFSSTLLATIITTVFNSFVNKRKDSIENITKERKTWRDELRIISLSISKSKNIMELQTIISELKVRINAYGIAYNSVFADSHIWEHIYIIESAESISSEAFQSIKRLFVNQISCLLKYDWERSKAEIKGNTQTRLIIISLLVSFLLYSLRWFYYYSIGSGNIMNFFSYCVVYSLFAVFAMLMINLADKWKNRVHFYTFILSNIIGIVFLYWLMYKTVPSAAPYDVADWILNLAPFITLIYAVEIKLLAYRRNVNYYILSSALASGATKIHKKYKVFFDRKSYSNLLTGETITFDNFEDIVALRSTNFSHAIKENTSD